jgi:hypothetical protein
MGRQKLDILLDRRLNLLVRDIGVFVLPRRQRLSFPCNVAGSPSWGQKLFRKRRPEAADQNHPAVPVVVVLLFQQALGESTRAWRGRPSPRR